MKAEDELRERIAHQIGLTLTCPFLHTVTPILLRKGTPPLPFFQITEKRWMDSHVLLYAVSKLRRTKAMSLKWDIFCSVRSEKSESAQNEQRESSVCPEVRMWPIVQTILCRLNKLAGLEVFVV